jgi:hypothetical protein
MKEGKGERQDAFNHELHEYTRIRREGVKVSRWKSEKVGESEGDILHLSPARTLWSAAGTAALLADGVRAGCSLRSGSLSPLAG